MEEKNVENIEYLSLEKIKKEVNLSKKVLLFIIGIIIFVVAGFLILFSYKEKLENIVMILIISCIVGIIPIAVLVYFLKQLNASSKIIKNGEFKIIEDKIYDYYRITTSDTDGGSTSSYYICSKIYGDCRVGFNIYNKCKENDSVYYIIGNTNEFNNEISCDKNQEIKRNNKNIINEYLANNIQISDELKPYFIPYDKNLGESNYNKRIEYRIEKLKEHGYKAKCRNCGNKFKPGKVECCPKCGEKYIFDETDVINIKN